MSLFQLLHQDSHTQARAGIFHTDHGQILTPIFMPVGTVGSVKSLNVSQLSNQVKAQIILGNTYHLYLRPGLEVLKNAQGLHRFMHWNHPILTDSGGYQVFSLSTRRKLTEEGALFQSHIDGSKHLFSPEKVVDIQRIIGANIIMAFDECPPYPSEYAYAKKSMDLTHRWLDRCINQWKNSEPLYHHYQSLFPIVQGGIFQDLRKQSSEYAAAKDLDGIAIGGLSVGEPEELMYEMAALCCAILPTHKPRYLMGVGTPWNILENISLGIDMFDCVMPTRNGRNGMLFTYDGVVNIKNKKWENDFDQIDSSLENGISNYYSKAYLRHLFMSNELLALQIASIHNLSFYLQLVTDARRHILENTFSAWKNQAIEKLKTRR